MSHQNWQRITRVWLSRYGLLVVIFCALLNGGLSLVAFADQGQDAAPSQSEVFVESQSTVQRVSSPEIKEVSPPEVIQELQPFFEQYHPQVSIVSPDADAIIEDDQIAVQVAVQDLELFQVPELMLGPHVQVFLDGKPFTTVYDVTQPIHFDGLLPGSHTVLAIACMPWNESFKNPGAVDQLTFHVFTKTQKNAENGDPKFIYNSPVGKFGAEPLLLDFILDGGLPRANKELKGPMEQVRVTINGQSFVTNKWRSLFLEGFKPGKNWIQLDLLDAEGNLSPGKHTQIVQLVNLQREGEDALSRLVRGEFTTTMVQELMQVDGGSTSAQEEHDLQATLTVEKQSGSY